MEMTPDIVSAEYKGEHRIELVFDNGRCGVVDFSGYLNRGGVFERFQDTQFFRSFKINEELAGSHLG
jgi:hypothetical protein